MNEGANANAWLEVHALAAEHGDCIVLSYGKGVQEFRLVVDAGTAETSERLKQVLEKRSQAVCELFVVSHIDFDHIGGTLALLADKAFAGRFDDVWFNGRKHLESGREAMGVAEGKALTTMLEQDGVAWNRAFGGGPVSLAADGSPLTKTLPQSGATLTILSPTELALPKLRRIWDAHEARPASGLEPPADVVEQPTVGADVEVLSIGAPTIADLADTKTRSDESIPNGSSIAFLFKYEGMSVLLGADAHASTLFASLSKLQPPCDAVDVFKVPHHGSAANFTKRLAQKLPARRYLFSTDGVRHPEHPHDVAIARALIANPDAELLFNYPNAAHKRWFERPPEAGYKLRISAGQDEAGIIVRLAAPLAPSTSDPVQAAERTT